MRRNSAKRRISQLCVGTSLLAVLIGGGGSAGAQNVDHDSTTVETVTVTGRTAPRDQPGGGLMSVEIDPRQIQSISEDFISKQVPSANPMQLLTMTPSANVQDTDPYGLQSGQTYIRGLDSSEVGWILEGTPLNDIGSAAFYANEQIEAEDLQSIKLQPGFAALSAPTITATAGTVFLHMRDPDHEFGILADATAGSDNLDREFIRLNTGDLGDTGVRAMLGYSHTFAKNWNAPGNTNKQHLDVKMMKEWEGGSSMSVVTSINWQLSNLYRYPTLTQYQQFGDSFGYDRKFAPLDTAFYRLNINPYYNMTTSVPIHLVANQRLTFDVAPYIWYGRGSGAFGSTLKIGSTYLGSSPVVLDPQPGQPSALGATVLVQQQSTNYQLRGGNTAQVTYVLNDHHTLNAGWWLQLADQHIYTRIGQVDQTTGEPYNNWGSTGYWSYGGGIPYDTPNYANKSAVNALWFGDSMWYLNNTLNIQAGFKYVWIKSTVDSRVPGADPHQKQLYQRALPQFSASYQIDDQQQVYFTRNTTFKTPNPQTVLVNTYNRNTGLISRTVVGNEKPEHAVTEELGYRYNGDDIIASISGFHYNMVDRNLTLPIAFGTLAPTQTVNAGNQETYGIDVQIATRPIWFNLRPYLTYEYLHARIESNLPVVSTLNGSLINDFLPTVGKTQISSPTNQFGAGLDYDDGTFFINGQVKYVSSQFSTFMNDQSLPAYVSSKLGMGVRLPAISVFKAPEVQLNLGNLGQTSALTGVNTFTTNAVSTVGTKGGVIAASQPTYFLMPHFTVALTISSSF